MTDPNNHPHPEWAGETAEPPFFISHFLRTLRAYGPAILTSMALAAVLYTLGALAIYLLAPSQRLTSLSFRLDFEGAVEGKYPNGLKFSPSTIVDVPILKNVFAMNGLGRYIGFPEFSNSMFVAESNRELEFLTLAYRARLSDLKLDPVDRDRIEREFQSKSASLAKNQLSLNYSSSGPKTLPDPVIAKVLADTLKEWSRHALNDLRATRSRVPMLSVASVVPEAGQDDLVAVQILRSKMDKVASNLEALKAWPGSELARTSDGLSLLDIETRLDELVRFRLDPLIQSAGGSRAAIAFLEAQLAHDQRVLEDRRTRAEAIRQALAAYTPLAPTPESSYPAKPGPADPVKAENVAPMFGDAFVNRLLELAQQSQNVDFRQALVKDLRTAMEAVAPAQHAVAYDMETLRRIRLSGSTSSPERIRTETRFVYGEVRTILTKLNEIYMTMGANLGPANELYTVTGVPMTRVERTADVRRLAVAGAAVILAIGVFATILSLIHNRVHQEEVSEGLTPGQDESAHG